MHIKATIVAYAFSVQCFENATIVAYAGLTVKGLSSKVSYKYGCYYRSSANDILIPHKLTNILWLHNMQLAIY